VLKSEGASQVKTAFEGHLGSSGVSALTSLGSSGISSGSLQVVAASPNCCVNFGCQLSPFWIEIFGLVTGESAICVASNVVLYEMFCVPPTPAPTPAPTPVFPFKQCRNSFECGPLSNCAYGHCIPANIVPTPNAKGCSTDSDCGLGGHCRITPSWYGMVGTCSADPNTLPCGGCPIHQECVDNQCRPLLYGNLRGSA